MEQKKTLLIALSAGIFLLVVFGTAALKYSSGARKNVSAIALKDSNDILFSTDTIEKKSKSDKAAAASLVIEPSAAADVDDSASFNSGTYTPASSQEREKAKASVTTIDMLKNNGAAPTESSEKTASSVSAKPAASPVSAQNTAAEKTVKENQNVKKIEEKPKQKKTTTAAATTAKPVASAKTVASSSTPLSSSKARYWVQVASFSSKNNAEDARAELERHRLPCEVFTITISGQLFYRVRVGGYATKGDAENVKKQINAIPMFKASNCFVTDVIAPASK